MTPALAVEGLTVEYRTGRERVRAVRDVSFRIGVGDAVALIGESGSGKSTVALALMRLLPPSAEVVSGRITYQPTLDADAVDTLRLSARAMRAFRWSGCAMVPQGAINALNPIMRVDEHFRDTAAAHRYLAGAALRRRGADVLRQVRLDPDRVWRAYPHELSGGMRQRVLIALALLLSPRVLLLDEPTTALDLLTQRSILDVLADLRRTTSVSLVFISHDLPVAAELADHVLTMYAGRLVEVGPATAVMGRPRHPYTLGLLEAMPSLDGDNARVRAIRGSPPDLARLPVGCPFAPRCPLPTEICLVEDPPLFPVGADHGSACHHWQRVPPAAASPVAAGA